MNQEALEKFYERLAETKHRRWQMVGSKMRCEDNTCPINAVLGRAGSYLCDEASRPLTELMIAPAADSNGWRQDGRIAAIRARMLEILGLEEQP